MQLVPKHWRETRVKPSIFHSARGELRNIEGEMHEVLTSKNISEESRPEGWHRLKEMALNVCDN